MGYFEEYTVIKSAFLDQWGDETIVVEDNASRRPVDQAPWLRFQVLGSDARVASIGGPQTIYRHDGDVVIEVFTPLNSGPGTALRLADAAAGLLRGLQVNGITFWAPRVVRVGSDPAWYRRNVICPFQRDEVFAH